MPNRYAQKPRKLLVITCSGGGGLLQAANAKEQEARIRDPNLKIVKRDTLKDWIWFKCGHWMVRVWNDSQTNGNVTFQSFCVLGQLLVDRLFWPSFFCSALKTFFQEDIDEIIDTQNMGTSGIVHALRVFNFLKGKRIRIQKVLVDLPTRKATHFFWPIKSLSKKNRELIQVKTIQPLLEKGETSEQFWQKNCRLSERDIHYEDLNVRQSFLKYKGKKREDLSVRFSFKNQEELSLMTQTYSRGSIRGNVLQSQMEFQIPARDRVITVLLGSQPCSDATFNYMKQFIQIARETQVPTHLFLFCSAHLEGEKTLFRRVADYVAEVKHYPAHFSVIPFSFQTDEVIAPLFFRSDITCTRSGGQTAMELMCVNQGEIWIHSEGKKGTLKEDLALKDLLKGIPPWEAANALYLQRVRGAKIVTTETFTPHARRLMQSSAPLKRSNYSGERHLESTA